MGEISDCLELILPPSTRVLITSAALAVWYKRPPVSPIGEIDGYWALAYPSREHPHGWRPYYRVRFSCEVVTVYGTTLDWMAHMTGDFEVLAS